MSLFILQPFTTTSALRSSSRYLQASALRTRSFHSTPAIMVKVGDSIPSIEVFEDSPGTKIDLSKELASGKGLIIGVPAAFSPGCSDSHIPGYMNSAKLGDAGKVFVLAVNDAFVMKAWQTKLEAKEKNIRFLADASGALVKALDLSFDATALLGNERSKRFALQTKDGKVTSVAVEPDNIGITVSAAEKVLG